MYCPDRNDAFVGERLSADDVLLVADQPDAGTERAVSGVYALHLRKHSTFQRRLTNTKIILKRQSPNIDEDLKRLGVFFCRVRNTKPCVQPEIGFAHFAKCMNAHIALLPD